MPKNHNTSTPREGAAKPTVNRSPPEILARIEGELKWHESLAKECAVEGRITFSRGRAVGIRELVQDIRNIIAGLR